MINCIKLDYIRRACGAEDAKVSKIYVNLRFCIGQTEFVKFVVSRTISRCRAKRNIRFTVHICVKTTKIMHFGVRFWLPSGSFFLRKTTNFRDHFWASKRVGTKYGSGQYLRKRLKPYWFLGVFLSFHQLQSSFWWLRTNGRTNGRTNERTNEQKSKN